MRRGRRPLATPKQFTFFGKIAEQLADAILLRGLKEGGLDGDESLRNAGRRLAVLKAEPDKTSLVEFAKGVLYAGAWEGIRDNSKTVHDIAFDLNDKNVLEVTSEYRRLLWAKKNWQLNSEDKAFRRLILALKKACTSASRRSVCVLLADGTKLNPVVIEWLWDVDSAEFRDEGIFFYVKNRMICLDDVVQVSHYKEIIWSASHAKKKKSDRMVADEKDRKERTRC